MWPDGRAAFTGGVEVGVAMGLGNCTLSRRVLQSGRVPLTAERTPWRSHRAQCSNLPRSISETLGGVSGG